MPVRPVVIGICMALAAFRAGAAEAPPGASSCSGCHAASAAVETPVPRLAGLPAPRIAEAMQAFRAGTAAGDDHAAPRQGLLRRRDRGDRGVVRRAAGAVSHAEHSHPLPDPARHPETRRAGRRFAGLRSGAGAGRRGAGRRDRRRLCRRDLRPRVEAPRPASRRDAGRAECRIHRLPVQQSRDRRAARSARPAIRLRQAARRAGSNWPRRARPRSIRSPAPSRSPTARACRMTG